VFDINIEYCSVGSRTMKIIARIKLHPLSDRPVLTQAATG